MSDRAFVITNIPNLFVAKAIEKRAIEAGFNWGDDGGNPIQFFAEDIVIAYTGIRKRIYYTHSALEHNNYAKSYASVVDVSFGKDFEAWLAKQDARNFNVGGFPSAVFQNGDLKVGCITLTKETVLKVIETRTKLMATHVKEDRLIINGISNRFINKAVLELLFEHGFGWTIHEEPQDEYWRRDLVVYSDKHIAYGPERANQKYDNIEISATDTNLEKIVQEFATKKPESIHLFLNGISIVVHFNGGITTSDSNLHKEAVDQIIAEWQKGT